MDAVVNLNFTNILFAKVLTFSLNELYFYHQETSDQKQ